MSSAENKRVLAIDPSEMGFGFAVLEGPRNLIDWGLKAAPDNCVSATQKNNHAIKKITELIAHYEPDLLITEDLGEGSRRRNRIRRLLPRIMSLSLSKTVKAIAYSKTKVRESFLPFDIHNNSEKAARLASWFPELSPIVPKYRKAWMPEDNRMTIFDALALAVVFYSSQEKVETDTSFNEKELQTISN